jgi:GNAT superfamily N-acetyltransferase
MRVQRQGFNPAEVSTVTETEIEDWRQGLGEGRAFLAYLDGQAASAGQYTPPSDGLVELVGIATLEPFRRKGLAAALTAQAVQTAFAAGVEVACLSAGDEAASRVYQRAGFYQAAVMLAYSDSDTS